MDGGHATVPEGEGGAATAPTADDASGSAPHESTLRRYRRHVSHLPDQPTTTRVLLLVRGWVLVLVGVAGLVLPGIQGILTIVFGAALLSLVSYNALAVLRWCFRPWPHGWRRMLKMRRRIYHWLAPAEL